jgi:LmbE family N-acetylglucosaminyl deacetylase
VSRVADLGTVLALWAHPDDETYLSGGLMSAVAAAGQRVVCATASAGEHGTPDSATWPAERLGQVRRWEAAAAMAVLGVEEHHVEGLPDGALADHDDEGRAWAGRLVERVRPDTVVTFGPDGITSHPDHIAVHRWATAAARTAAHRPRLLHAATTAEHVARYGALWEEWGVYMTEDRPAGVPRQDLAVHLQLTGADLDRKVTALAAMATQTGALLSVGREQYAEMVAEEGFVDAT